ncbi:porin [Vibrio sp. UCD-FRSSP16_10]|uniref:carbohydrate porin n=1 Tax=unclassified Vibrio TaxID=2614977 RepID=UPI0007FCF6DE|nr:MULTISPECIES: carbohydrate porin [unclassified Vibrio]OBT12159.1 porin [Vibrio sp. UCD-FRSSP16_30]OBT20490.1 porin [Vibrio sp. UCD-FRSSP16_10]
MTPISRLCKTNAFVAAALMSANSYANGVSFEGPDSVENTIATQKQNQKHWREDLADNGFTFGADYFSLGLYSGDATDGGDAASASGVARVYGQWNLVGKNSANTGSLVWKFEHRHAYSDTSPKDFSGTTFNPNADNIGYLGMIAPAFSDQGFRVTDLNWKQKLNDGRSTIVIGWQDVTNYVDTYALASPWTGFTNLAFSTGAGAMGLPDDGILALSAGHMITDNYYVVAGVADAKGQSDDIFNGFDTLFNDHSLFTTLELGWTASQSDIYTENFHVTFWHMDQGSRHSLSSTVLDDGTVIGGESGRGVNFSYSTFVTPQLMPFVRGGFSQGDVALYDKSISAGFGYFGLGSAKNNLGFAVNWSETNDIFGNEDQFSAELYYNMQLGDHIQITPDVQFINNPALSTQDTALVFGVRGRVFF